MHIFLVNDDGIGAKGIMALVHAAVNRGHEVTMCAPRDPQSGASHRFSLIDPSYVSEWPTEIPGCKAWSITGSPVDCVRVGLGHLVEKPADIVISGINNGYNSGVAVHYSGTVGAAMEGAFHHLHAMAVSIHHESTQEMLDHFAHYCIEMAEKYVSVSVPDSTILNINAPLTPPEELQPPVYVPLDTACYTDGYVRRESPRMGTYFWLDSSSSMEASEPGSDNDYLSRGHITLTLMGHPAQQDKAFWDALHIG